MRYSVAYLMHVDWNWIKQRPHFLYEQLTFFYKVDLIYIHKVWERKERPEGSKRNVKSHSKVNNFKKIPYSGRFPYIRKIENKINSSIIKELDKYNIIWITSPIVLDFVDVESLKGKFIIYDCMDDFPNFYKDPIKTRIARDKEKKLIKISNIIIASSYYLKRNLESTYADILICPLYLVNNGISSGMLEGISPHFKKTNPDIYNLFYIGTVGDWIDFEILTVLLERYNNINITMIGPVTVKKPKHPRLLFTGQVKHEELIDAVETADAFIMPFKVNELIRSVDPVKVYEYIFFGKPVMAVKYKELNKFLPYIHLYEDEDQLFSLVEDLQNNEIDLFSRDDALTFLRSHTWEERCKQIVDILKECYQLNP